MYISTHCVYCYCHTQVIVQLFVINPQVSKTRRKMSSLDLASDAWKHCLKMGFPST